jgi:hypothetical protein
MPVKAVPIAERFDTKWEPVPWCGCWLWTDALDRDGYGHISGVRAHRQSWKLFRGEIPRGVYVLHECDVPSCVNPDHLFLGTQQDNLLDMARKDRGSCSASGLPYGVSKQNGTDRYEVRIFHKKMLYAFDTADNIEEAAETARVGKQAIIDGVPPPRLRYTRRARS